MIYSQSWKIDTLLSHISYKGVHPFHTFIGVTNNVDFKLNCENDICNLGIAAFIEGFDSGNNNRDSNMLYYTKALLYPTVTYHVKEFDFNGDFNQNLELIGTLTFHGVSSEFPIDITLKKNGNEYWGTCNFSISLKAFNIERPTLLMIPIEDTIEIETKLKIIET